MTSSQLLRRRITVVFELHEEAEDDLPFADALEGVTPMLLNEGEKFTVTHEQVIRPACPGEHDWTTIRHLPGDGQGGLECSRCGTTMYPDRATAKAILKGKASRGR